MHRVVDQRTHLKGARKKRWEGKTPEQKAAAAGAAAKARWDKMTDEERSTEMKRRRAKGVKKTSTSKPKRKKS